MGNNWKKEPQKQDNTTR